MVLGSFDSTVRVARCIILAGTAVACSSDVCVNNPCPSLPAAIISVTAPNAPNGITGLTWMRTGAPTVVNPCFVAAVNQCTIGDGPGTYHVQLMAPNYKPLQVDFTATGTPGGCGTCGSVDTQRLSVVLEPST